MAIDRIVARTVLLTSQTADLHVKQEAISLLKNILDRNVPTDILLT